MREILIADDHELLREGLVLTLAGHDPRSRFSQCGTWAAVHLSVAARHFDLILADLFMPRRHAWEDELALLLDAAADTPVCILSASAEPVHIRTAAAAGVRAYLTKTLDATEILAVLDRVLAGERVFPFSDETCAAPVERAFAPRLTTRQRQVLERIAAGASNREIATALDLTEHTVKRHVYNLCRLLGADNRVRALALARANGILARD